MHSPRCRQKKSAPNIYYHSINGHDKISVITNDKIGKDKQGNDLEYVNLPEYRKCGATLDENDAFIAKTCEAIQFRNWISIRNVSDLPQDESIGNTSDDQYDLYGHCSSINGAFAIWAFINGR